MTRREKKINRIWNYLQKISDKETLEKINMRAFLYSVGRLSYEQVLIELVATFYGKDITTDQETKTIIEIMEGTKEK